METEEHDLGLRSLHPFTEYQMSLIRRVFLYRARVLQANYPLGCVLAQTNAISWLKATPLEPDISLQGAYLNLRVETTGAEVFARMAGPISKLIGHSAEILAMETETTKLAEEGRVLAEDLAIEAHRISNELAAHGPLGQPR